MILNFSTYLKENISTDKLKISIDEVSERFRKLIENYQFNYYSKILDKLKKDYPICIENDIYQRIQNNFIFINKLYVKETDKPNTSFILIKNDIDKLRQICIDESKSLIQNFTIKISEKINNLLNKLNHGFKITTKANNDYNDFIFEFYDDFKFTIRCNLIHSISSNTGTPYYTYNIIFIESYLPNGTKIQKPNENNIVSAYNKSKINENLNYVNNIINQIDEFIKSKQRNKWIYDDGIKIYIRNSLRYFNGNLIPCLDLASIEIDNSGNGIFTNIFNEILEKFKDKNIFVESILTDRFYNFIKSKGFVEIPSYPQSLIKIAE